MGGHGCNMCKDTGFILKENNIASECGCQIEVKNKLRLKNSGLETAIEKYTFENYSDNELHQKNIKRTAEKFVKKISEGEKAWFFIGGQSGVGKTHICTAICSSLMNQKLSLKYAIANKAILKLKSLVMNVEDYYREMGQLIAVDVLYIDDLFKAQSVTNADVKVLFEILNDRYIQNKITIISSEKTIEDLENIEEFEALSGRIIEKAENFIINIKKDTRKNFRKRNFLNL